MTKPLNSTKFSKWKQPLIFGLLAIIPAVLSMSGLKLGWLGIFFIGFIVPVLIFDASLLVPVYLTNPPAFFLVILFWFLVGAIFGYAAKKLWLAIIGLLLLDMIFVAIGFALCLFCQ